MHGDDAERVRRLEAEVAALRERLDRLEQAPAAAQGWRPVPGPAPPQAAERTASVPATKRPAKSVSLEERLGANWLPKAGIVVLVLGVVFFLRFAFDAGWIGLQARIALGVVGGIALAILGDLMLTRRRFGRVYPQVLTGGGIVVAYFSIFAAYAFDAYREALHVDLEADALLLGLIAVGAAAYATWRRAPVLASEAGTLVALTVLFAASWTVFAVAYLVGALSLLLLAASFRRWVWVPPFLLFPAYVSLFAFLFLNDDPFAVGYGALGVAAGFVLTGVWADGEAGRRSVQKWVQATAGILTWLLWMTVWSESGTDGWYGWTAVAGVAVFAGLALVPNAARNARIGWGIAALVIALAWPPAQFDGTATVYAWSALVAAGAAVTYWRRTTWSDAGLLAAAALMVGHLALEELPRLADDRLGFEAGNFVFLAATVAVMAAWAVLRPREGGRRLRARALLALGLLLPILFFGAALDDYGISIAWAVEAVLLVGLGFALRLVDLRYAAFVVFGLVLVRVFVVDIADLEPIYRIITFLVVGVLLLVVSALFARRRGPVAAAGDETAHRPPPKDS